MVILLHKKRKSEKQKFPRVLREISWRAGHAEVGPASPWERPTVRSLSNVLRRERFRKADVT